MTVCEFCELYVEQDEYIEIWSNDLQQNVFEGTYRDAANCTFSSEEVSSFGIEYGELVLNI